MERHLYADDFDFMGGSDSAGSPYTFSDGVGRISYQIAKRLSGELKLDDCVPSCFQVDFD